MHFMVKEEALKTMRLFGVAAENKGISKSFLKDWMVWLLSLCFLASGYGSQCKRYLIIFFLFSFNYNETSLNKIHFTFCFRLMHLEREGHLRCLSMIQKQLWTNSIIC